MLKNNLGLDGIEIWTIVFTYTKKLLKSAIYQSFTELGTLKMEHNSL